jgi:hypothetical protein
MSYRRDDHIIEGDIVTVTFENLPTLYHAKIVGFPMAEGDTWKLRLPANSANGPERLVYVQHFCTMERES